MTTSASTSTCDSDSKVTNTLLAINTQPGSHDSSASAVSRVAHRERAPDGGRGNPSVYRGLPEGDDALMFSALGTYVDYSGTRKFVNSPYFVILLLVMIPLFVVLYSYHWEGVPGRGPSSLIRFWLVRLTGNATLSEVLLFSPLFVVLVGTVLSLWRKNGFAAIGAGEDIPETEYFDSPDDPRELWIDRSTRTLRNLRGEVLAPVDACRVWRAKDGVWLAWPDGLTRVDGGQGKRAMKIEATLGAAGCRCEEPAGRC